ncbi:MAG: hypothetical protein DMG99_07715 [Acidobacteria bacterium]|nr:MAG: hypothetical protein DMG99_07715 [Acidobacteriota bacterium]
MALSALDRGDGTLGSTPAQKFLSRNPGDPMLDSKPRNSRFNMQTILGFLLGVVASLLWMFFAVFVGGTLGPRHTRMYAWFGALGFAVFGFIAAKQARSSYALGMALAFGLAILLLAGYTLALYRSL